MILILSEELDKTTDKVIDWLSFKQEKFIRINKEDNVNLLSIIINNNLTSIVLEIKGQRLDLNDISVVWYRRNGLHFNNVKIETTTKVEPRSLKIHSIYEKNIIKEFIELSLSKKKILGRSIHQKNLNKLYVLEAAAAVGLKIPESAIVSQKKLIPEPPLITKAIGEVYSTDFNTLGVKKRLITYTVDLNDTARQLIAEKFFPSLFQRKIDKQYEIRVFHIDGVNYAMALFSQKNLQTKVDFRRYDYENPNRTIPFSLPHEINIKINTLMVKLGLDTGSIDMLVDKDGHFYFLEINPNGQFGMVSVPCNYYLEKIVADSLINKNKRND